ncbi:MAG: Gfo/Idh/MocA family oxidoreductase [Anaerolineae bacterium]|nr:Gfo/Idh/MocA family oxidoreductase [Anaerolineae bacterium]
MRELKVGVIGLKFGQFHVQTFANMDGVRLVALADRTTDFPQGFEAYAARYGAVAYKDGVEMLEEAELDAVSICTSPRFRAPLLAAAARRGVPMFIEKPWAANMHDARNLAALAEQTQAQIMSGFSFRFHPAVRKLRQLMDSDLGVGILLNGEYLFDWIPASDNWLWDPENGGGFFNENSCHLLDVVCHLMGEPLWVFAQGVNTQNSPSAEAAVVTLGFDNDSLATLMIGGIGVAVHANFPRLNIISQNGQALLKGREHYWESLTWASRGADSVTTFESSPEALGNTRYSYALQHFIEQVRNGGTFSATIADGIRAVAIAQGIYQSLDSGQRVLLGGN